VVTNCDHLAKLKYSATLLYAFSELAASEKNYDIKFSSVFEAIHELMTPPETQKKHPIGFAPWGKQ
jgi:hypothetical protein